MKPLCVVAAIILGVPLASSPTYGDEFAQAATAMCDRVKACALEDLNEDDTLNADMKRQIISSMDGLCVGMKQNYSAALTTHELYQPATACLRSMAEMTCEQIDENGQDTPQCRSYEELSRKYE